MITALEAFADAIMEHEGFFGPSSQHPLGSRSWRNRNPGNLEYSHAAIGADAQGFAIFAGLCDGYNALLFDLQAKISGRTNTGLGPDSTIQEFFNVYSPKSDANDPSTYALEVAEFLSRALGRPISTSSLLSSLAASDGDQRDKIQQIAAEG